MYNTISTIHTARNKVQYLPHSWLWWCRGLCGEILLGSWQLQIRSTS